MPFVDDRGRVFGRLNLIDAAVVALLVLAVPLGAAAYLMFRAPTPKLVSVEPTTLQAMVPRQRIQLHGENLRPYLRVTFGGVKAVQLLLLDFTSAEVVVPELPPGRYDVTLYDQARELGRLPNAIVIPEAPPEPKATVRLVGIFRGLTAANAEKLKKNPKLAAEGQPPIGKIIDAAPPQQEERWLVAGDIAPSVPVKQSVAVPATIRIECTLKERQCRVDDLQLAPRVTLRLPTAVGSLEFYIEDVRPDRDPVDVDARVTFLARPAAAQLVSAGDRHTAAMARPDSLAWLVSVSPVQAVTGQALYETERSGGITQRLGATIPETLSKFDALVHLRAEESPAGLRFHDDPVKVGATLTFETDKYIIRGVINSVQMVKRPLPGEPSTKP